MVSYISNSFLIAEMKPVEKATVRYSYAAENEDELSLEEGEVIVVLDKDLEDDGWWKGELRGKAGVFPNNFVELIKEEVIEFFIYSSLGLVYFCLLARICFLIHVQYYVSPLEGSGDILFFPLRLYVCVSVGLCVCLSVRHKIVSAP